jgi:hypothetical protein
MPRHGQAIDDVEKAAHRKINTGCQADLDMGAPGSPLANKSSTGVLQDHLLDEYDATK